MEKLLLIDGSSLAYRSFYAFINNPLRNSKGMNTSGVFGFVRSLNKVLKEIKPEYVAVSFDLPGPTFRHREYAPYKATRKKMPDELARQLPIIRDVVKGYGIRIVEKEGFEADDIILTIAKKASEKGKDVIIFTFDKDIMQTVDSKIKILNMLTKGEEWYGPEEVEDKFGVKPRQIPDLLSLIGDSSDNIPGVPSIGPKTAAKLIKKYGSIEEIYRHILEIKSNKIRETLLKFKEQVMMAKELTNISPINMNISIEDLKWDGIKNDVIINIFKKLEFFSLIRELGIENKESFEVRTATIEELGPDISIIRRATEEGPVFYFSDGRKVALIKEDSKLREIINSKDNVVFEDAKSFFHSTGILLERKFDDICLMDYLINPNIRTHNIERILLQEEGIVLDEKDQEYFEKKAYYTKKIRDRLMDLMRTEELLPVYREIEVPLIPVLFDMEKTGIKFDIGFLKEFSKELGEELEQIEEQIFDIAGERFNLRSPKQLSQILFEKLGLPAVKKTKTGYSTDAETLAVLSQEYEIAKLLLSYREQDKLKSSYADALPKLIDKETGRIHCTFNQTIAATGRITVSEPNLQTLPIRGEIGREIRKALIAESGFRILSCDYSQIELRILAHITGDKYLIDGFRKGKDIHTHTASVVFQVAEKDVTPVMRRQAKVVNFGLVYGMSAFGLAKELGISQTEASVFIENYFRDFGGVKQWIDTIINFAKENGFVRTLFGRKRRIPELSSKRTEDYGRRIAINTPIQGTAADLIKLAMIDVWRYLKRKKTRMILQIHDELLFEISEDEIEEVIPEIKKRMENIIKLDVPLIVDAHIGNNWAEAH
ncbi:DNA polymerase I [candidate division WOR-3 bacterium]|nr:DNA polymerase I [candidate division WOR-3 bacterium]